MAGESFPDGSRMAGQIKMIGQARRVRAGETSGAQEGGIITCPTASEDLRSFFQWIGV